MLIVFSKIISLYVFFNIVFLCFWPETNDMAAVRSSTSSTLRALVVDDDRVQKIIGIAVVKSFGYLITEANNGKEAVDLYESGERFNLIIMDMEMPIMDGIEVSATLIENFVP